MTTDDLQVLYIPADSVSNSSVDSASAAHNRIDEVIVFLHQALVKRKVSVPVSPGQIRLMIETTCVDLDSDSVQGKVMGLGEIYGVQHKYEGMVQSKHQDIAKLEKDKRALNYELDAKQKTKDQLEKQRRFLDSIANFGKVEIPAEIKTSFPKVDDLKQMMGFLSENYEQLDYQLATVLKELDETKEKLDVVEDNLGQHRKPQRRRQHFVEVLFHSQREQTLEIEISYLIQQAAWKPLYRVNVAEDLSNIELSMMAQITQNSGESWHDVHLICSNAVPLRHRRLPEPVSWRLTEQREHFAMPATALGAAEVAACEAGGEMDGALVEELDDLVCGGEEAFEAEEIQAFTRQSALSCEYQLPLPMTVETGERETMVPLEKQVLNGSFYHYAIPQQTSDVMLVCVAAEDQSLLAGQMNIHYDGQFVGSTRMSEKVAGEELVLNLGIDPKVKVRREKTTDKLNETFLGMMDRSNIAREMAFNTTLENLKEQSITVRLCETIPISNTDRIQVKDLVFSVSPTEENWKKQQGAMLWEMELNPAQIVTIDTKFYIKHPKELVVEGL